MKTINYINAFNVLLIGTMLSCANPNKAEKIDAKTDGMKAVTKDTSVGLNKKGEMIARRKVQMTEELKNLEKRVYTLEEDIYGNDELGNRGKWGVLRDCMKDAYSKDMGGDGKLHVLPEKRQVTKKESQLKIGLDEDGQLVGVSDEYLKDRIERFKSYEDLLGQDKDFFEEKIRICQAMIEEKKFDQKQLAKLAADTAAHTKMIESSPDVMTKQMDDYICDYVRPKASLKEFMIHAVDVGWLKEVDLREKEVGSAYKDTTGFSYPHTLKVGNWALAYTDSPVYGELMNLADVDAHLLAWQNTQSQDVAQKTQCLTEKAGRWNKSRKTQ